MTKKRIMPRPDRSPMTVKLSGRERDYLCALLLREDYRVNGRSCKKGRNSDVLHRLFWKLD